MKIYEDLVNLHAVSGFERQVRKYMRKELEKYADEIVQDRLGSIFGIKKGEGPVIMIAGHPLHRWRHPPAHEHWKQVGKETRILRPPPRCRRG